MNTVQQLANLAQRVRHANRVSSEHAQKTLDKILQQYQDKPEFLNRLGLTFYQGIDYDWAKYTLTFLVDTYPNHFRGHSNLGLVLNRFGLGQKAAEHYRKAIAIKPDYHPARSNLAYVLHYFGETGRDEILQAHKNVATYAFPETRNYLAQRTIDKNPDRKLRIGYVSSDFREHAVGHFIQGILQQHNRQQFEIHIFDNRDAPQDITNQHLKSMDLTWHIIKGLDSHDACTKILEQEIDILIDLSGHTNGGRIDIFCHRVAPVQATYLGYPNTSGLPTMDFRIGDSFADLEQFNTQNTEVMMRLPHAMWNYTPWQGMPDINSESQFQRNGYITFGSANNHAKLQPEWIAIWASMMQKVEHSRLILKSRSLKNPKIVNDILAIFAQQGIAKERISFKHFSANKRQHWQDIADFDIGLDAYPYNGTTTTCDKLWLGVPIVTLAGNSHVSRTTASILNTAGLTDWIAYSEQEFIDICVAKAKDASKLNTLRQSLRQRMQQSPLNNATLFISAYEHILRDMWTQQIRQ